MSIIYCTTFNSILYQASGQALLKSFALHMPENHLLVCYEDDIRELIIKHHVNKLSLYNLDNDFFLDNWLNKNADIIPEKYGGQWKGCDCGPQDNYLKGHRKQCPSMGFNARAACWFRKIATLHLAYKIDYDIIVFVDCDSVFKKNIPDKLIEDTIQDNELAYHLGPHRKSRDTGIESGFIIFQKPFNFLDRVIDSYTSKDFRKYDRWDDGYVIKRVLYRSPDIKAIDLVGFYPVETIGSRVMERGPFSQYIRHDKGKHSAQLKIFTESL